MKVSIRESERKEKRLMATFTEGERSTSTHFGQRGASTFIDHGDKKKRDAYLARHKVRENWDEHLSAGSLSRWLLWGEHTTLQENLKAFKRRFNLS